MTDVQFNGRDYRGTKAKPRRVFGGLAGALIGAWVGIVAGLITIVPSNGSTLVFWLTWAAVFVGMTVWGMRAWVKGHCPNCERPVTIGPATSCPRCHHRLARRGDMIVDFTLSDRTR